MRPRMQAVFRRIACQRNQARTAFAFGLPPFAHCVRPAEKSPLHVGGDSAVVQMRDRNSAMSRQVVAFARPCNSRQFPQLELCRNASFKLHFASPNQFLLRFLDSRDLHSQPLVLSRKKPKIA